VTGNKGGNNATVWATPGNATPTTGRTGKSQEVWNSRTTTAATATATATTTTAEVK